MDGVVSTDDSPSIAPRSRHGTACSARDHALTGSSWFRLVLDQSVLTNNGTVILGHQKREPKNCATAGDATHRRDRGQVCLPRRTRQRVGTRQQRPSAESAPGVVAVPLTSPTIAPARKPPSAAGCYLAKGVLRHLALYGLRCWHRPGPAIRESARQNRPAPELRC